jgi:hypothetical protein
MTIEIKIPAAWMRSLNQPTPQPSDLAALQALLDRHQPTPHDSHQNVT